VLLALTLFKTAACRRKSPEARSKSISPGQTDAAKAIGLTFAQRLAYVILPQAVRRFLPPWINSVTDAVKGSALVSLVGIVDLMLASQQVIGRTYEPLAGLPAGGGDLLRDQLQPQHREPPPRGALRLHPGIDMSSEPIVRVRALKKSFGTTLVLDGVDLDVARGEAVVVIGPSGSGKTTLLRCVNLLEPYDDGSIKVDGVEVGFREPGGKRRSESELAPIRPTSAWCSSSSTCFRI
jgi:ABC-type glutathione transport system ATPase component